MKSIGKKKSPLYCLNSFAILQIYRNGCVDSAFQSMTAAFMALGKKDISKVTIGPLTPAM